VGDFQGLVVALVELFFQCLGHKWFFFFKFFKGFGLARYAAVRAPIIVAVMSFIRFLVPL